MGSHGAPSCVSPLTQGNQKDRRPSYGSPVLFSFLPLQFGKSMDLSAGNLKTKLCPFH